jgi:hypothetical protein
MHQTLRRALELIAVASILLGLIGLLLFPRLHIPTEYSVVRLLGYDGPIALVYALTISGWVIGFTLVRLLKRTENDQ